MTWTKQRAFPPRESHDGPMDALVDSCHGFPKRDVSTRAEAAAAAAAAATGSSGVACLEADLIWTQFGFSRQWCEERVFVL